MVRRGLPTVLAALLLVGCTGETSPAGSGAQPTARPTSSSASPVTSAAVPALATLRCGGAIDGGPPPQDFSTVLGVVALPVSPAYRALQAFDSGDPASPALFAKTGLLVRAGQASELDVPADPRNRVAIGWGNAQAFRPSTRFAVPACPDTFGTGWLAYPGGYWADQPLCLPLTVRAGGREQRVRIGIGTACAGRRPPA